MTRRDRAKARAAEPNNDYEFFEREDGSWILIDDAGYVADWGGDDPYEALDDARNLIAKYEAVIDALRDLGFCKGWESVNRWYGSGWRPVHDALRALEDR